MVQRQIKNVRYDFTGNVVLVTGAARGQGRSHALAFAQTGADVVISDICGPIESAEYDLGTLEQLVDVGKQIDDIGVSNLVKVCDVRDETQVADLVDAVLERYGRIDILVNNAGIDGVAHVTDISPNMWDDMIDTHVRGAFLMSKAVAPTMMKQVHGKIIMIGSMGSFLGLPSRAHYITAKHALAGLTKALALDLAKYKINVNILPWCGADLVERGERLAPGDPAGNDPLGRYLEHPGVGSGSAAVGSGGDFARGIVVGVRRSGFRDRFLLYDRRRRVHQVTLGSEPALLIVD